MALKLGYHKYKYISGYLLPIYLDEIIIYDIYEDNLK